MAELKKYGFIVKGSGYVVGKDSAVIDSGFFHTTIMAVANVDDAISFGQNIYANQPSG
jgi:hypothetical protein